MIKGFFRILLVAAVIAIASPAGAQKIESNLVDSEGYPYSHRYFTIPLPLGEFGIQLRRRPDMGPSMFSMQIVGTQFSGCPEVGIVPYTVSFRSNVMELSYRKPTLDMRELDRKHEQPYNCNKTQQIKSEEIVLDRDDLIRRGINRLATVSNEKINSMTELDINENRIKARYSEDDPYHKCREEAQAMLCKPCQMVPNPAFLWFYPDNTVILRAPRATRNIDQEEAIARFAAQHGLQKMEDMFPEFNTGHKWLDMYVYLDTNRHFVKEGETFDNKPLGTVEVAETVYGLEKDETVMRKLEIHGRTPYNYE